MTIDDNNGKEGDGAIPILIKTRRDEGDTGQLIQGDVVLYLRSGGELLIKKELGRLDPSSIPQQLAASCHNPDVSSRDAILRWVWKSQENFFTKSAIEVAQARIKVLESSLNDRFTAGGAEDLGCSSFVTVDGVSMPRAKGEEELSSLYDRVYSLRPADLCFTASEYRLQLVRAAQAVFDMIKKDLSLRAVLTDDDLQMLQKILDSSTTCDEL